MPRQKKQLSQDAKTQIEEELHIAEMEADLQAKEQARASHELTSREKERFEAKKRMEEAMREQVEREEDDATSGESEFLDEKTGKSVRNPRLNPNPRHKGEVNDARLDRRRQRIWAMREKYGLRQRRKIYTPDGEDTGATTSAF